MSASVTKPIRESFGTHRGFEWACLPCLRCGAGKPDHDDDGPGRHRLYCGDACRRAGNRLRRKRGSWWYEQQPWYAPWCAEQDRKHEEWEAARPERERKEAEKRAEWQRKDAEKRKLAESMPPEVRAAYEAERKRDRARGRIRLLQLDLDKLQGKYQEDLSALNMHIQLMRGSVRAEKALWAAALATNEHEAQALFAKARQLCTDPAEKPRHGMEAARDAVRDLMASFGPGW